MKTKLFQNTGLFLLAVVFSIGLMFAFTELPRLTDELIQSTIPTPHSDPAYDSVRIEMFYNVYAIRLIGYICLGLILLFIVLGFTTRKSAWAFIGSVALFLPVFATFAHSMFYLAGLGLFNVILFPFLDISLVMVDLGKVVLIPYWILMRVFHQFNWYAHNFLMYFFMGLGAFIFVLGVFAWFQARYSKNKVAQHWIYRYSRHPQYLGWIIWSYGLMLYGPTLNQMKKSWGWYGTLPWLLSTMIIIGICMLEEIKMKERAGNEYDVYRNRTPFLFPLQSLLKRIIEAPMKFIIRKNRPENRKDVGVVIFLYTIIFIGLSLFWVDLSPTENIQVRSTKEEYSQVKVDSLLTEITKIQPRRYRSLQPYNELILMGSKTHPALIKLINDRNPEIREFAIIASYRNNIRETIPALVHALHDPEFQVANTAIRGLNEMKAMEAKDTLLYFFEHPTEGMRQQLIKQALSNLKCTEIIPVLIQGLDDPVWYHRSGNLSTLSKLDLETAKPYIYKALEDNDVRVRRDAVNILLEYLPTDAIPHLEKATKDSIWEVRFYSRQAIRLIEEKQTVNN